MSRDDVLNEMVKHRDATWCVAVRGFKPRVIGDFPEGLLHATIAEDPKKQYVLIHKPTHENVGCIEWIADERIGFVPDAIEPHQGGYVLWFKKKLP